MRFYTILFILLLSLFIGSGLRTDQANAKSNESPTVTPRPVVLEMIGRVNQQRILTDLKRLTGVEPLCTSHGCITIGGRESESEGLQWAKEYVYETLIDLHYSVEVLKWSDDGIDEENILAYKPGILYPDEAIYFIAHLDGKLPNNPAADDDASGVVSLLELARILSGQTLSRPVVLFISTGEEDGSLGSHTFVEQYPERLEGIKYLISVEMLGWDSNNDGEMQLWPGDPVIYPSSYEFAILLDEIITSYSLNLVPQVITGCD